MVPQKIRVAGLYRNAYRFEPGKRNRLGGFFDAFESFVIEVVVGRAHTDADLERHPYFAYLKTTYKTKHFSKRHALKKMRDAVALIKSVQKEGIKDPVTLRRVNGRYVLCRGYRRLVIAHVLGIREVLWTRER